MALLNNTPQEYYDGNDFGSYQFVSLKDIINQFMVIYVGEDKIIPKAKRLDVAFHAQRALAELSFDTLKSVKAQEVTVPASLQMILPQDYVNYTKISTVDSAGIKHLLYPASKTSNPQSSPLQDADGNFTLQAVGALDASNNIIVLDKEYKDILVGMLVVGPYIPAGTIVASTSNAADITTITIESSSGIAIFPLQSNTGTTLTFEKTDGSLFLPQKESYIIENLSWNLIDYKITGTASELTNIKVGMIVSHDDFPIGTTVTNVYTTTVVLDQLPVLGSAAVPSGGEITFVSSELKDSTAWSNYKSQTPSENNNDDYDDDNYWPINGERYGLDPQHAQVNGSFYIDQILGKIHFSSNIAGKTVILDYISDSLGTDGEMQVHKFAEEAMYKWISHAILSGKANIPEYQVLRFKKERFAAIRTAKLRLSNLKLEELTQILRGKSKQIKH
tara:strand:+ start:742 stop:2082 length:1341 start_codon:yes stop_codon:yes gene_type:complete